MNEIRRSVFKSVDVYEEGIVKKIEGNYVGVEFCEFRHRDAFEAFLSD